MFRCPLCNQEVEKELYEKITGLWTARQKVEEEFKRKAARLDEREQKLRASFAEEKKKFVTQERKRFQGLLSEQKKALLVKVQEEKKELLIERKNLTVEFNKKLAAETKKIIDSQKIHLKEQHDKLKLQFDLIAKSRIEKENAKLQIEKERIAKDERLQANRYNQLNRQFSALQSSSTKELQKNERKIRLLQEQIKKNQTPQVLGLLEENVFLDKLLESFPNDKFDHPGKGGDIIHHIIENKKEIGLIVYELKKVGKFSPAHVEQAYEAKQQRNADYGILVTNAKRNATDIGFSVSKGILIIHPTGAIVLISILRDNLVSISRLKLTKAKREATIDAVLEYVQGPVFKNSIDGVIQDSIDLYNHLQKEVKDHIGNWELRYNKYRSICEQAGLVRNRVVYLLDTKNKPLPGQEAIEIKPIELPAEIQ
jgi:hypothetical protein